MVGREKREERENRCNRGKEAGDVNTSCTASRLGQAYPVSTPSSNTGGGKRGGGSEKCWRVENWEFSLAVALLVDYRQARRASKPHQDQPQQATAFLMHQDTSLTTTIEHPPQGKRQGQPQQAAAYLTLPGAGGLPDSRKHHTPGRLLSPLGYPGPERVSAVQKPPSRYPF
ncbi:hypothetical protein Q5P01_018923 [Channa striata]|uniref:Uncharacterized protein n=1 Tax=Channa striata TaxID=64152 RepID=A0AA88M0C2_CHASR|nr:hypothetical protein Q5P01_018923 [Channa striata]